MNVTFDNRSVLVDGKREILLSGAVHYPRSTPAMWPRILRESKRAGLNCIETYVFWEGHEPQEGCCDFTGRFDLGRFLDLCREEGLYAILRIGPYVCAEWSFGGLPWWLITKPGMVTRTYNEPFMRAKERWVRTLLDQVGDRQATHGGPVILAQMENEYNNVARRYGEEGQRYLAWCAEMARSAGLEVPLVMCVGASPDAIETLNGFSVWGGVEKLLHERPFQPALWTENWPAWYDVWGQPHHLRRPEEIAYEVARFFAAGGTGVNYYMWHGGTNFARDAMYLQTTSYDFNAPIDEYGLPTTKSEHLALLHRFLGENAAFLLEGERRPHRPLLPGAGGEDKGVHLYPFVHAGRELAFVVNADHEPRTVDVGGKPVELPTRSVAALVGPAGAPDTVVYQSWAAPKAAIVRQMAPAGIPLSWEMLPEPLPGAGADAGRRFQPVSLPHNMLLETRDETDFGWYRATVTSPEARTARLSTSVSDFLSVWVNGRYVGSVPERLKEDRRERSDFAVEMEIPLEQGENELLLLAAAIGLIKGDWMIDAPQSEEKKGLLAPVLLDGRPASGWEFAAGVWGERVRLQEPGPASLARWRGLSAGDAPLRWYRAGFTLDEAQLADGAPWALRIGSLFKGTLWLNGRGLGRYWQVPSLPESEADPWQHAHILVERAGRPPQEYYHLPADWLQPGENTLIVLEERGRLPEGVELIRRR